MAFTLRNSAGTSLAMEPTRIRASGACAISNMDSIVPQGLRLAHRANRVHGMMSFSQPR